MNGPCCFQCFTIRFSSSAEIGTDRTFPLFVPLNVMTPFRTLVGFSFSASDHQAPVAKRIIVTSSTCGLSQPARIESSSSAICCFVSHESSRSWILSGLASANVSSYLMTPKPRSSL